MTTTNRNISVVVTLMASVLQSKDTNGQNGSRTKISPPFSTRNMSYCILPLCQGCSDTTSTLAWRVDSLCFPPGHQMNALALVSSLGTQTLQVQRLEVQGPRFPLGASVYQAGREKPSQKQAGSSPIGSEC